MSRRAAALSALLFFSCGASQSAEAPLMDGRRLLAYCDEAEKKDYAAPTFRTGHCIGFVEGTLKGWEAGAMVRNTPLNYCFPGNITLHQILRTVTAHLRANAAALGGRAELLVIRAVQEAYPCRAPAKR